MIAKYLISTLLGAALSVSVAGTAAADGADTVKKVCALCHGTGAGGAPMIGSKADWADRIKQGKDTLYQHALKGFQGSKGMMPPKGGSSLPDADVKAAVDYMLSQVK